MEEPESGPIQRLQLTGFTAEDHVVDVPLESAVHVASAFETLSRVLKSLEEAIRMV